MAVVRGGGRGAQQRGRQRGADHSHPELMSRLAHDQELHQQFVMPLKVESGIEEGSSTGTSSSFVTTVADTITVPDWATKVTITAIGTTDMTSPTNDGLIGARVDIDGTNYPLSSGHYHSAVNGDTNVASIGVTTLTDPGSTVDVSVEVSTSTVESAASKIQWTAIFERFA